MVRFIQVLTAYKKIKYWLKENFDKLSDFDCFSEKYLVFILVIGGTPINSAINMIRMEDDKARAKQERWQKFLEKVFKPFIKFGEWLS